MPANPISNRPRGSELLRELLFEPHAEGELGMDNFVRPLIAALDRVPIGDQKMRVMAVRGLVFAQRRAIDPAAFGTFKEYCDAVFSQGAAGAPPPSRLGQRTIADVLEGVVRPDEFATFFYQHLSALSAQAGFVQFVRDLIPDYRVFPMVASGEYIPEIFPEVSTLGALLAGGYKLGAEEDPRVKQRLEIQIKTQLALAWIAHQLARSTHPIFASETGGRIAAPEVQRLERLINAASLVHGDGRIPKAKDFDGDFEWTRNLVELVRDAVIATELNPEEDSGRSYIERFDEEFVKQTFAEAMPYLSAGFELAFALIDAYAGDIEHGGSMAEDYFTKVPTPLWRLVPEADEGADRAELIERPAYDWLKRAIRLEFQARYYSAKGNYGLAALRAERAAHELKRAFRFSGERGDLARELNRSLVIMADRLDAAAGRRNRFSFTQPMPGPVVWAAFPALPKPAPAADAIETLDLKDVVTNVEGDEGGEVTAGLDPEEAEALGEAFDELERNTMPFGIPITGAGVIK